MSDLNTMLAEREADFRALAPKWLNVERLLHLALAARSRNPALVECSADSWLSFCMRCAETGLEPIGAGGAWPVPFKNNKTGQREVQFIPDWRGLIQLAKRTGQIKHAYGEVICEGDYVDYQKGDDPRLIHKPPLSGRGEMVGVYCVVTLPDGSKHIEYRDKEWVDSIRARSKAAESGPWVTDYVPMAIKSVVRLALKPFAASPQLQAAIEYDNQAVGLALPDHSPLMVPKAVTAGAVSSPTTEAGEQTENENIVEVLVGKLGRQDGPAKSKKDKTPKWVRWYFQFEGVYYSTFDAGLAELLETCQGQRVKIETKKTAKGIEVKDVVPDIEEEPAPEEPQDGEPVDAEVVDEHGGPEQTEAQLAE